MPNKMLTTIVKRLSLVRIKRNHKDDVINVVCKFESEHVKEYCLKDMK